MNHKWPKKISDEQLATFKSMWEDGKSYKEIEAAIGVSASALGSSRARWGLAPRVRMKASEKNRKAAVVAQVRKETRDRGATIDPLPSLFGLVFTNLSGPTDATRVSHKFMPEHKCAWPIDVEGVRHASCGAHCDTPGPYCDDHRKIAYMTREEAAAAWVASLGKDPRKL